VTSSAPSKSRDLCNSAGGSGGLLKLSLERFLAGASERFITGLTGLGRSMMSSSESLTSPFRLDGSAMPMSFRMPRFAMNPLFEGILLLPGRGAKVNPPGGG
jgi:hypothetical protein